METKRSTLKANVDRFILFVPQSVVLRSLQTAKHWNITWNLPVPISSTLVIAAQWRGLRSYWFLKIFPANANSLKWVNPSTNFQLRLNTDKRNLSRKTLSSRTTWPSLKRPLMTVTKSKLKLLTKRTFYISRLKKGRNSSMNFNRI